MSPAHHSNWPEVCVGLASNAASSAGIIIRIRQSPGSTGIPQAAQGLFRPTYTIEALPVVGAMIAAALKSLVCLDVSVWDLCDGSVYLLGDNIDLAIYRRLSKLADRNVFAEY